MNPSTQSSAPEKKSRGRQKIKMVKMEKHRNLQVTFSKRRAGLFKKASELCTLCGAEAAIVVFSPAEKAYCFGHPNVNTVVDKLSTGIAPLTTQSDPRSQFIAEAHRNSTIRELNLELTQAEGLLRAEKRVAQEIEVTRKARTTQQWFPTSFDGFNYEQLRVLKESIMGLKKDLDVKVQREMVGIGNPVDSLTNFHHQKTGETGDFGGFSHGGVGVENFGVPTSFSDPQLSLQSGDFSNAGIGFSNMNGGFVPNYGAVGEASNNVDSMSNISRGLSDAVFFGGGNNGASSSKFPIDSNGVGSGGFGLGIGYDHGLF